MKFDNEKKPVLGIDLGTTYSAIARWTDKGPKVYQNPQRDSTWASVVYFDSRQDQPIVGNLAVSRALINPENAVIGVKRMMDDAEQEIQIEGNVYTPIDISAMILKSVYSYAENTTPGFNPSGVVVTVPYYFTALQCQNTTEAAKQAGLNVLGILQEPIAAALAYGLHEESSVHNETIMVFDLGGGTFDLTIFKLTEAEDELIFEVMATGGDDRLGGLDFDKELAALIKQRANLSEDGLSDRDRMKLNHELMSQAKKVKESLSFEEVTDVIAANILPGQHLEMEVTREELETVLASYFAKMDSIIDKVVEAAGVTSQEIDRVIKVGGSSRIPKVDRLLNAKLGSGKVYGDIDPDLCVAQGASIYGAFLDERLEMEKKIVIRTATAHDLGVGAANNKMSVLIRGNRKTPCEATQTFTTNVDNCRQLDIKVYQGSSKMLDKNMHIGTIHIDGLVPKPAGELDIKITFKVTAQQTVSVDIEQKESNIRKIETLKLA